MADVRPASPEDVDVITRVAATGFYADPVMTWLFPDDATRLERLTEIFSGVARDMEAPRGVVHLADDASVALWRDPSFDHHPVASALAAQPAAASEAPPAPMPFTNDEIERLIALGAAMERHHPHEPHWYLNVVSTLPDRQGTGLGAAVLQPVLDRCDADGVRAYLESSNPRNLTLYRRHGFVDAGDIELPDGPSMRMMWREPRG